MAAALTIIGTLCELGGIYFVVRDFLAARRAQAAYETRDQTVHLPTLPIGVKVHALGVHVEGEEPTLEERLARLEQRFETEARMREEADEKLRKSIQADIADAEQRVNAAMNERVTAVERLVYGTTVGVPWQRWIGIGLVVVGIVLQAVGAVIG